MTKLILILLGKILIGMLLVCILIYTILEICTYVGNLYGDIYGFLLLLIITIINVVVSNKIKMKREKELIGDSENYTKIK